MQFWHTFHKISPSRWKRTKNQTFENKLLENFPGHVEHSYDNPAEKYLPQAEKFLIKFQEWWRRTFSKNSPNKKFLGTLRMQFWQPHRNFVNERPKTSSSMPVKGKKSSKLSKKHVLFEINLWTRGMELRQHCKEVLTKSENISLKNRNWFEKWRFCPNTVFQSVHLDTKNAILTSNANFVPEIRSGSAKN